MIYHRKDINKINNCNKYFFRDTEQSRDNLKKSFSVEYFSKINRYYSSLHDTDSVYSLTINDCFALKLAGVIIEKITTERIITGSDKSFSNSFYNELASSLADPSSIYDNDLLVIFLKQMVNIMRAAGLISVRNNQAYITEIFSGKEKIYPRLLRSFWNECDWREIFPSSPEAAEKIYDNRDAFLELIKGSVSETSVEDLSNDFFNTTGISESNDYFMISFVDFYLLTWLKHFGIIEYNIRDDHDIVLISVTDYGRKVVNSFL